MTSVRSHASILILLLSGLLGAPPGAQAESPADLLRKLQSELDQQRYEQALQTARQAIGLIPDNHALWYNLAGLEDLHGDPAAAIAAFARAVDLGFDDFRHADQDLDLGGVRSDPTYATLRAAWAADLTAAAGARGLTLTAGQWSEPFPLPDQRGDGPPAGASVRLRMTTTALEFEVQIAQHGLTAHPPWRGGSGLLAAVLLPAAGADAEGAHHFEFGIGLVDDQPAGSIRLADRWQRLEELTPKIVPLADPAQALITFAIPWSVCGSLHPLVDATLGVNLTYVRRGDGATAARSSWLHDPAAGRPDRPWRRGVPIRWAWHAGAGPALQAQPSELVVREGEVSLDPLAVVVPDARAATVQLVVRDHRQVLQQQVSWQVDGPPGHRTRQGALALDEAPAGSARLGASYVDQATGKLSTWETELLILPRGWEARTAARIARAPTHEQPSLQHRLEAIEAVLSSRHRRDNPAALGTTVDELMAMLERIDDAGTSLEAGRTYLAVMPTTAGRPGVRCSLYLPDGWTEDEPARLLLLLAVAEGGEQRAVSLAPRFLAERARELEQAPPPVVMAVPHLGELPPEAVDLALFRSLIAWLQAFTGCGPAHVAGVDLLAASVLELAAEQRSDVAGILMITGLNFVPYPGDAADDLAARVAGLDPGLPAGWIWFPDEQGRGDQAADLRRGLRQAGLEVSPAQAVPGGLNFTQAWTRALDWALQP